MATPSIRARREALGWSVEDLVDAERQRDAQVCSVAAVLAIETGAPLPSYRWTNVDGRRHERAVEDDTRAFWAWCLEDVLSTEEAKRAHQEEPAAPLPARDWHCYADTGEVDGRTRHVAARRSEEDAQDYVTRYGGWYRHEPQKLTRGDEDVR